MSLANHPAKPALSQLPSTYAIALSEIGAIKLEGEEQTKYLQGQVTCDVNESTASNLLHGAHCDAKGKVFSVFRLFNRDGAHMLLQEQTTIEGSQAELQKFSVFAKVEISQQQNLAFCAFAGDEAATTIKQLFNQVPDALTRVINVDSTTIIYIAGSIPRFILVDESATIEKLLSATELPVFSHDVWRLLEINQGFPILGEALINQHAPQVFNVQAINGISFTKGCYLGQETVARMQYLGKNKRAMFSLTGEQEVPQPLASGHIIEKQLGENWRRAGEVVNAYTADSGEVFVQAILASDITAEDSLRIKSDDAEGSNLAISTLPYSLNAE